MTWFCSYCEYMNSINDLFCCNCHRRKDNLALKDDELPTISTSAGSFTPHSTDYITYDDYGHEYHKASSLNRLEIDAASHDLTSTPVQDPHGGRGSKVWFCCDCTDGPHGVDSVPACTGSHHDGSLCNHVRCANCEVVRLKKKVKPSD